jgi:hypothetical protein
MVPGRLLQSSAALQEPLMAVDKSQELSPNPAIIIASAAGQIHLRPVPNQLNRRCSPASCARIAGSSPPPPGLG